MVKEGLNHGGVELSVLIIEKELCKGCRLCISACHQGVLAIGKEKNSKGFRVIERVNADNCTMCTLCAVLCPELAIQIHAEE